MTIAGSTKLPLSPWRVPPVRTLPPHALVIASSENHKPGMLRVDADAGHSIKLELWALSAAAFGKFSKAVDAWQFVDASQRDDLPSSARFRSA